MTDYEMEEFADMAVIEFRDFINTEAQLVEQEHNLVDKLASWDYVIGHLDEREGMEDWYALSAEISQKLIDLRDVVETGRLQELQIINEEGNLLKKLKTDVEHRDWRAVKADTTEIKGKEQQVVRLQKDELREVHTKFIDLMKIIKRGNISLDKNLPAEKEEYKTMINYYFSQIYKFARAYERIFRHLWRKEAILYKSK